MLKGKKCNLKVVAIMIVIVILSSVTMTSFASAEIATNSSNNAKYEGYDMSNISDVAKLYVNDVEFQNLVKGVTAEKIKQSLVDAVKISKDKTNKDEGKMSLALENLKALGAIDSNYKIITDTKAQQSLGVNNQLNQNIAVSAIPSFDLRGNCITNANTMKSTYSVYYSLGIILYGNPISAGAYAYMTTGVFFTTKVKNGGEWDYKIPLGYNTVYKVSNISGYSYYWTGETIGNFHYGYTGSTIFPSIVLLSAAGLVQIISGTANIKDWSTYFDSPSDQDDINSGIYCYNNGI